MNICLLNDSFPPVIDGVANVVMNYADVLTKELGSNVVVGTPGYPGASYDGYPYKVVAYPSFDTTDFVKGYRTGNPLSVVEIAQLSENRPEIIHTHCPAASTVMARILRKQTGAPVVFTYHTKFDVDIARAVGEGFLKKETIRTMISNIEACDDVWVVSEGAGDNLRSLGYEGDYRVMPNGVDFPKGRVDDAKVKEVTSPYDIPEGIPVYLFVGRIMKYKGLPLIIEALSLLSKKGIEYRMIFVGGGADAQEMQQLVKEKGIPLEVFDEGVHKETKEGSAGMSGKIIFVGAEHDRERLKAWNTRADLFLFPSVYDTNGIVVREAAACGLSSVLIKNSCAAEGITDGRNGFVIDETPQAMAAVLEKTSGDLEFLHRVGQNAMDEIYISWDTAVRLAYDRYKEIREMVADGELGIRKHQSFEYLMNSAAIVATGTRKVFVEKPRTIYDGMRDNFQEVKDNLEDFRVNLQDELKDMKNDLKDIVSDIKSNFTNGFEKIKGSIAEEIDKLGDELRN